MDKKKRIYATTESALRGWETRRANPKPKKVRKQCLAEQHKRIDNILFKWKVKDTWGKTYSKLPVPRMPQSPEQIITAGKKHKAIMVDMDLYLHLNDLKRRHKLKSLSKVVQLLSELATFDKQLSKLLKRHKI